MSQDEYEDSSIVELRALIDRGHKDMIEDIKRQDIFIASINASILNVNQPDKTKKVTISDMLLFKSLHGVKNKAISIYDVETQTALWSAVAVRK